MPSQIDATVSAVDDGALPTINAVTFAGGYNLPAWVAQSEGFLRKHGVILNLQLAPNSVFLMTELNNGRFDVAMAGIDNLIAYQEGQGEVALVRTPDLAAFMGFDNGFLHLVGAPEVQTIADLRGKKISVDAFGTGFAYVLREMIRRAGLSESEIEYVSIGGTPARFHALIEGKQSATLLSTPFDLQAEQLGCRRLASAHQLLKRYMGRSAFAKRAWLRANESAAIGLMRAYRDAMEWIFDPGNRERCEALLVANDAEMNVQLARRTYEVFTDPSGGFFRGLAPDLDGMRVLLELRSKYARPAKNLTNPFKYVDRDLIRRAFPDAIETRG